MNTRHKNVLQLFYPLKSRLEVEKFTVLRTKQIDGHWSQLGYDVTLILQPLLRGDLLSSGRVLPPSHPEGSIEATQVPAIVRTESVLPTRILS